MKKTMLWTVAILFFLFCLCSAFGEKPAGLKKKAGQIHDRAITVDSHTDTPMNLLDRDWDIGIRHTPGEAGSGKIDFPRMKEGGLDAAVFAVFVSQANRDMEGYASARMMADRMILAIRDACEKYPDAVLVYSAKDIRRAVKNKKTAILMGLENGYPIGRDLICIRQYYDRGIRYITLCHSRNNDLCDSSTDPGGSEWQGLSPFGEQTVREMNRLGLLIDVSHISDEAFFDVLRTSPSPVIASHSCCRALYDHPRNLSDSMLVALSENGGVIQINLCSFYLKALQPNARADSAEKVLKERMGSYGSIQDQDKQMKYLKEWFEIDRKYPGDKASVTDLADHIDHAVRVAGIDHVGIGSDFDGGAEIIGCMDVSELQNITDELVRRGYSEKDIHKIWGGNFLRVFKEAEEKRKDLKN